MNTYSKIAMLVISIIFVSPCVLARDVVKIERSVGDFNKIHMMGTGNLILAQDSEASVLIEANKDASKEIQTSVRNGVLTLEYDPKTWRQIFRKSDSLTYYITAVELDGIEISGSGNFQAESIVTDQLTLIINGSGTATINAMTTDTINTHVNGSGTFSLAGRATHQEVDIRGSGEYRAGNLISDTADVRISGSGKVAVNANEVLKVKVSGSGLLEYTGSPKTTLDVSGSGKIVNTDTN